MHAEGESYRRRHNITSLPVCSRGIYSDAPEPEDNVDAVNNVNNKPVSLQAILHTSKITNNKVMHEILLSNILWRLSRVVPHKEWFISYFSVKQLLVSKLLFQLTLFI